jgi:flagellar motor switch protein FliM
MSSRKLTSEEVDALMEGLQASDYEVQADVADSSDVRAFQFGQDDLSLMGDYYALRLINERFARHARGVFLPMLRLQPRISPFPPEVKTFDEYCEGIDNFMNLNISRMEELRGPMLLTLGPKFISTLTASFYGGSIYQPDQKRTEFTNTEERVIELVHEGLSECLSAAWTDLMPITLSHQGREVNPQFASFVDGSELVIICAFLIQLPNGDSVNMDVVYPLQTLKPIATQLRSRMQSDTNDDVSWRERMEHAILNIPLNVTAFLGKPVMSMGQLIRLQTGDVVPIQVNEGIELRVEDNPIFLADIGEVSGQAAVSLTKRI